MCREWLKQINSLTFLVLEEGTLDKLKEDLRAAVEDLKVQVPHEAELIKESSSYVTYSLKKGIYWDSFLKSKIKKSELSRGVEIGPEKRRAAIILNIKDTLKKKAAPHWRRISEQPEDGALYDSDFQTFFDLTRPDEQKELKKNLYLLKASTRKISDRKKANQNKVLETNFVSSSGKPKSQKELIFSVQWKGNILRGKLLMDESVNLVQNPLAKQSPEILRLIDIRLKKMHQFEII